MAPAQTKSEDAIDKLDRRRRTRTHIILQNLPALSFNSPAHSIYVQFAFPTPAARNKMAQSFVTSDMFRLSTDMFGRPVNHEPLTSEQVDEHVHLLLHASARQDDSISALTQRVGSMESTVSGLKIEVQKLNEKIDDEVAKINSNVDAKVGLLDERITDVASNMEARLALLSSNVDANAQFLNRRITDIATMLSDNIVRLANNTDARFAMLSDNIAEIHSMLRRSGMFQEPPQVAAADGDLLSTPSSSQRLPHSPSHPTDPATAALTVGGSVPPTSRSKKSGLFSRQRTKSFRQRLEQGMDIIRGVHRDLGLPSEVEDVPAVPRIPFPSREELSPGSPEEQQNQGASKGKQRMR
ncbi:hypothetical protein BC628DRAFT_1363419 [Trametes gibbosa]|nr:hypothetical protein BC628DRAFT_1363419 [Trametes gibbosa]